MHGCMHGCVYVVWMCICVSDTYLRNKPKVPAYPFNDHRDTLCPRLSALARSETSVKPERRRGTCCGVLRKDDGAKAVLCMRTRIPS